MEPEEETTGNGDRILRLTGVVLVFAIAVALAIIILAGAQGPPDDNSGPDVNWTISRINETVVRIQHAGGEQIDASNLVVTVDGRVRHPSWPSSISEGDHAQLNVQSGQTVRIIWEAEPGSRTELAAKDVE